MQWCKGIRLALFGLALLPLAACTPKIDTAFKPDLNQPRTYRVETTQDVTMDLMGTSMVQKMEPVMDLTFTPAEIDANGAVAVKMSYDDVQLKQSSSMGGVEIDLNKVMGGDASAKMAQAVKGQSVTAHVAPKGDVASLEGDRELARKVRDTLKTAMQEAMKGQNMPPQALENMMGQDEMAGPFSGDQIKSLFMELFGYYPPNPVKVGDSWTKTTTLPGPGSPLADEMFTVASAEGDQVTIKFERDLKPNPEGAPMQMGPAKGRLELTGKFNGTAVVDRKSGWLLSLEEQGDVSGKLKIEGGMGMAGPMEIPMKQTSHMTIAPK